MHEWESGRCGYNMRPMVKNNFPSSSYGLLDIFLKSAGIKMREANSQELAKIREGRINGKYRIDSIDSLNPKLLEALLEK